MAVKLPVSNNELLIWFGLGWRASPIGMGFVVTKSMLDVPECVSALGKLAAHIRDWKSAQSMDRFASPQESINAILTIARYHPNAQFAHAQHGSEIHNAFIKLGTVIYGMVKN